MLTTETLICSGFQNIWERFRAFGEMLNWGTIVHNHSLELKHRLWKWKWWKCFEETQWVIELHSFNWKMPPGVKSIGNWKRLGVEKSGSIIWSISTLLANDLVMQMVKLEIELESDFLILLLWICECWDGEEWLSKWRISYEKWRGKTHLKESATVLKDAKG